MGCSFCEAVEGSIEVEFAFLVAIGEGAQEASGALDRAVGELRRRGRTFDPALFSRLSPLSWDRINLSGDYVWPDSIELDADGLMPLQLADRR